MNAVTKAEVTELKPASSSECMQAWAHNLKDVKAQASHYLKVDVFIVMQRQTFWIRNAVGDN